MSVSARELEVFRLIHEHYTTAEIAKKLFISEHTVRSHVKNVFTKIDAKSRREAIHELRREGLLTSTRRVADMSKPRRYRKKPVVVEAVCWLGTNFDEIARFASPRTIDRGGNVLFIATLEGVMNAQVGDWIIKGVAGEIYPCKPDIFGQTYEEAE